MKIETLMTKKAGFNFPVELMAAIVSRRPTAIGFVVQDGTGKTPELSVIHEAATPSVAQLEEFQRNAHDFNAMAYFGELGSKFNPEDIGPFIIKDGNGQPFMAVGLEGDFNGHTDLKSGRTEAYNLASKFIIPTLVEVCEYAGGDLEKIMATLNDDRLNESFLEHVGHRGVLTIFPLEGDPIWFGKNEIGGTYDWGQTSNRHGFDDVKQEPEKVEEPKKFAGFSFGKKQESSPPALPKEEKKVQDAATPGNQPRKLVPEVRSDGKNLPQPVKLPDWVHKNDDKRTWYQMVGGAIPEKNWKNGTPIIPIIPESEFPKDLGDLKMWEAEQFKKRQAEANAKPVIADVKPIQQPKTETSAGAPKTGAEIAAQRKEESQPLVNAKNMEKILDIVARVQGEQIPSIADMQAIEKKIGTFSSNVASTPKEMIHWPMSAWFAIGNTDIKALVMALMEFRSLYRDTLDAKDLVGTLNTEKVNDKVVTTETKIGDTGKKVESVVQTAPPAKKPGFSFGGNKKVA